MEFWKTYQEEFPQDSKKRDILKVLDTTLLNRVI